MTLAVAAIVLTLSAGCEAKPDEVQRFDEAIRAGASCDELLTIRDDVEREVFDRETQARVNRQLDELGCHVFIEDVFDPSPSSDQA